MMTARDEYFDGSLLVKKLGILGISRLKSTKGILNVPPVLSGWDEFHILESG